MIVRELAWSDVAAVQAIDRSAHGEAWSERVFRDEIEQANRLHLVATEEAEIVAHAAALVDHACCHITNVAVAEPHHRRGLATAMLIALFDAVLDTGDVAYAQLEVRPSNRSAQRLYSRFGFVPVTVSRNFYDRRDASGSTDALIMAIADVCDPAWRTRLDKIKSDAKQGAAA